jgi:hypothetical protein
MAKVYYVKDGSYRGILDLGRRLYRGVGAQAQGQTCAT